MSLKIGDTIDGKYQIVRLLGEGGMGAVYEGLNTRIHRRVAIKVLHAGVAGNEEAIKRFEREAQAAGRIGSKHIVEVLDLGDLPGGERYMVMEFLDGEPLSSRIARGKMSPRDVATIVVSMLDGLEAAHQAGIVHRDLKPDNVFLLSKGNFTKIVDFGISKFNALGGEFSMTRTGAVMGTPYYMAPEQAKGGRDVDHRADVYAVGVILYQAVVGAVPFDAATFNELLFKIVLETPPSMLAVAPGIDPSFVEIVEKAMARELSARYQTAAELKAALESWLGGTFAAAGRTVAAGTPALDVGAMGSGKQGPSPLLAQKGVTTMGATSLDEVVVPAGLPVKRGNAMLFGLGAGLLVLGGLFFVFGRGAEGEPQATDVSAASVQSESTKALEEERKAAIFALEQERKKAELAGQAAREAQRAAEDKKEELDAQKAAANEASSTASQAAATPPSPPTRPSAKGTAPRPSPARPTAAARSTAGAEAKPAPTSGGRPIRTDLDL